MEKHKEIDETLLAQTAAFTPEHIPDFCMEEKEWVKDHPDCTIHLGYTQAGFKIDGRIRGFMWRYSWEEGFVSTEYYACGLADDQMDNEGLLCSVGYRGCRLDESEYMLPGLLERDGQGRIIFCGVHQGDVRHGLGSEFSYDNDGKITELQGLWQNGVLTHRRSGGELIPVE